MDSGAVEWSIFRFFSFFVFVFLFWVWNKLFYDAAMILMRKMGDQTKTKKHTYNKGTKGLSSRMLFYQL